MVCGGRKRVIILGAAGRDFHNFNTVFRECDECEIVCFTAQQIPGIAGRTYPKELSGRLYPEGIAIHDEEKLEELIKKHEVHECILSYSDLSSETVMELAARVLAAGSSFKLLNPYSTLLKSNKPVIAITAVRTGCGKSQTSRYVNRILRSHGLKVCAVRHPMPYGDLNKQTVQRFETLACLDKHNVTVEEREEYEMHIKAGTLVWAGVDYQKILEAAEKEADIVLWDGGNNDTPFFKPDLLISIADPLRVGHEITYYPGCVNIKMADIILLNKCNTASQKDISTVRNNIRRSNPKAKIIECDSVTSVDKPELIKGKKVIVVEDGPTATHGEIAFGAGTVAASRAEAVEIVDPRPFAVGLIQDVYKKYPHLGHTLPAVGYSKQQLSDLEATIEKTPADSVVLGTPAAIANLISIKKPFCVVGYELADREGHPKLSDDINAFVNKHIKK